MYSGFRRNRSCDQSGLRGTVRRKRICQREVDTTEQRMIRTYTTKEKGRLQGTQEKEEQRR